MMVNDDYELYGNCDWSMIMMKWYWNNGDVLYVAQCQKRNNKCSFQVSLGQRHPVPQNFNHSFGFSISQIKVSDPWAKVFLWGPFSFAGLMASWKRATQVALHCRCFCTPGSRCSCTPGSKCLGAPDWTWSSAQDEPPWGSGGGGGREQLGPDDYKMMMFEVMMVTMIKIIKSDNEWILTWWARLTPPWPRWLARGFSPEFRFWGR